MIRKKHIGAIIIRIGNLLNRACWSWEPKNDSQMAIINGFLHITNRISDYGGRIYRQDPEIIKEAHRIYKEDMARMDAEDSDIQMYSDSYAVINGVQVNIDTIYGDYDTIGEKGYYIHVKNTDGDSDFGTTFYTIDGAYKVFNEYLEKVKTDGFINFREFETDYINSLPL